ncbi:MAG: alpha-E domain-containing protein [Immundisolibacter sp.]|uniref:alpha-E domain-containing protein n=1 Tax=Immundisolibacter sp. TaxID=1934948 RepID=UPI003EE0D8CB
MLSRVAERVYWMARYLERAENTARLLSVYANLLLDLPNGYTVGWHTLIGITGIEEPFREHYEQADEHSVVRFLLTDMHNSSSVLSTLAGARENVRTTRDLFPAEAWEAVNELHLFAREHAVSGVNRNQRHEYLTQIILGCQQLTGLLVGTLSHDDAYDFVRLGRSLERADMTTRILDVGVATLQEQDDTASALLSTLWINVLRSLSAYQMYRRHVRASVNGRDVAAFLLRDGQFPRAVRYCVDEIEAALRRLPRGEAAQRSIARISRLLTETDPKAIEREAMHDFIDDLQLELGHAHTAIAETWFPVPVAQPA